MLKLSIFVLAAALVAVGNPNNVPSPPFRVTVVEGDGALNNLPSRAAQEPIIRVADGTGKPITGALVEFDVPKAGPGIMFGGGTTHFSATTNSEGIARAKGIKNNGIPGGFAVLVHVSYQGQAVGDASLHQTNLASNITPHAPARAKASGKPTQQEPYPDASMSSALVGVAMGDQFLINGTMMPTNANLAPGSRIQTKETPVTVFIHDHCEFLVGPHSSVIVQPHLLNVMDGAVRAKHFGDCKFGYGGLWVTSPSQNGDAVVALTSDHMQVGSVNGEVEVSNALKVVNTIQSGAVSTFSFSNSSNALSGATINKSTSPKVAFMLGVGAGASLLGLGLAVDAIVQPSSSGTPTSP